MILTIIILGIGIPALVIALVSRNLARDPFSNGPRDDAYLHAFGDMPVLPVVEIPSPHNVGE